MKTLVVIGGIVARNRCGDNFHRCPGYSVSTAIRGYARELSDSACAICRSGPFGVGHRLSAFEAGGTEPGRRAGPSCIQCGGGYLLCVGRCGDLVPGLLVMAGRRAACRDRRCVVSAVSGKEFAAKLAFGAGVDECRKICGKRISNWKFKISHCRARQRPEQKSRPREHHRDASNAQDALRSSG